MCTYCLAHYMAELILQRKRTPVRVCEYLAREYGDYQADLIMIEVNKLISRVHRKAIGPVMTLGRARVCSCDGSKK